MKTVNFKISNHNGSISGIINYATGTTYGVLICLHGSPNGNYHGNADFFDQMTQSVVPLGYTTVQFSMYGSPPSDGQQVDSCIRTQLIDYNSILEFVKGKFNCPIFVVGESAGATIASLDWKSHVKGYLLMWPAFSLKHTDLEPYLTKEWWDVISKNGYIDDNGVVIGKELFIELLFTDFSKSFLLPEQDILIIHGQQDKEVPYWQSIKALENANGQVTFFTIKEADHGFKDKEHRKIILSKIVNWLSIHKKEV